MSTETEQQNEDPAVDTGKLETMQQQVAVALALVGLATTRTHRAAKLLQVEEKDLVAVSEEIGAIEDLLVKINKELA